MDPIGRTALSQPKKRSKTILTISIVLLTLAVSAVGAYFLWFRPMMAKPLSATLDLGKKFDPLRFLPYPNLASQKIHQRIQN